MFTFGVPVLSPSFEVPVCVPVFVYVWSPSFSVPVLESQFVFVYVFIFVYIDVSVYVDVWSPNFGVQVSVYVWSPNFVSKFQFTFGVPISCPNLF